MPALARPARAATATLAAVALAALTGCGSDAHDRPEEVVVTVTASPSPSTSPSVPSPSASAKPAAVRSDVKGRRFDFGLVEGHRTQGGADVVVIDRWTDPRVDDALLARQGLPVEPYELGASRYVNQNTTKSFDVPVREGTSFLLNHCVARGEPLQTRSVSAKDLAAAPEADRLVLVELDDAGYATGGETFAGC